MKVPAHLNPSRITEVVMTRNVTEKQFNEMLPSFRAKGWFAQKLRNTQDGLVVAQVRKETTFQEYYGMIEKATKKGWWILAYEPNYWADGGYYRNLKNEKEYV